MRWVPCPRSRGHDIISFIKWHSRPRLCFLIHPFILSAAKNLLLTTYTSLVQGAISARCSFFIAGWDLAPRVILYLSLTPTHAKSSEKDPANEYCGSIAIFPFSSIKPQFSFIWIGESPSENPPTESPFSVVIIFPE